VNKYGATTGDLGSLQSSQDGIAQQRWPDTTALKAWIDGERASTITEIGSGIWRLLRPGAPPWATAPAASAQ